ncbi:hypothetical protein Hdeb2414_s0010g00348721 [Helianthus debilis subsp. tardiflorus]
MLIPLQLAHIHPHKSHPKKRKHPWSIFTPQTSHPLLVFLPATAVRPLATTFPATHTQIGQKDGDQTERMRGGTEREKDPQRRGDGAAVCIGGGSRRSYRSGGGGA